MVCIIEMKSEKEEAGGGGGFNEFNPTKYGTPPVTPKNRIKHANIVRDIHVASLFKDPLNPIFFYLKNTILYL